MNEALSDVPLLHEKIEQPQPVASSNVKKQSEQMPNEKDPLQRADSSSNDGQKSELGSLSAEMLGDLSETAANGKHELAAHPNQNDPLVLTEAMDDFTCLSSQTSPVVVTGSGISKKSGSLASKETKQAASGKNSCTDSLSSGSLRSKVLKAAMFRFESSRGNRL